MVVTVATIWECTLSASSRDQSDVEALLLRPSATNVPGLGMLGMLECTVHVLGSYTRSYIGCVTGSPAWSDDTVV